VHLVGFILRMYLCLRIFVVVDPSLLILDNMKYTDCCIMKMEQFSALNEQRFSVLRQTHKDREAFN